jgi:hypothetical protein
LADLYNPFDPDENPCFGDVIDPFLRLTRPVMFPIGRSQFVRPVVTSDILGERLFRGFMAFDPLWFNQFPNFRFQGEDL